MRIILFLLFLMPYAPAEEITNEALPPYGFINFCYQEPEECQPKNNSKFTNYNSMVAINAQVNHLVKPIRDGEIDLWQVASSYGDCEDIVLLKRKMLIDEGFDWRMLSIAVAKDSYDDHHAVLLAKINGSIYVLDSMKDDIDRMHDSPYEWDRMQTFDEKKLWINLLKSF